MTYPQNVNTGATNGHSQRMKVTVSLELEWEEHWGGHAGPSSGVPDNFAGFPNCLHEFATPPVNQGPWREYTDVEELEEEEPFPGDISVEALAPENLSIDEWLLPGTDARIRICAPAEGLGDIEPSGTTRGHVVARALHVLRERLRMVFRPDSQPVTLEAVDLPAEE
jgi:hypothetical protein